MNNPQRPSNFDPYQPLAQNLATGDRVNRWMLQRPRQKIVQMLKGQSVLDVCCGTGSLTGMLAEAGCPVVGVDSSPTMLALARRKQVAAEFVQMDAVHLAYQHRFDAAVINLALHEMPPPVRAQVWEAMCRAVRPGGLLIALDFAVPQRSTPLARFTGSLIEQDERGTLNYHPEHYHNFQEFMRGGGLLAWMQQMGQPIETETRFWGGTLALVIARQSD